MALFSNNNGIFSPSGKQIIPSVTSADAGKVLSVDDNGDWGAVEASGGGIPVFDFDINGGATNCRITPHTGVTVAGVLEALSGGLAVARLRAGSSNIRYLFISRSETTQHVFIYGYDYTMNISGVMYDYIVVFEGYVNGTADLWSGQIIGRYEIHNP